MSQNNYFNGLYGIAISITDIGENLTKKLPDASICL